jgi:hypothetical protein
MVYCTPFFKQGRLKPVRWGQRQTWEEEADKVEWFLGRKGQPAQETSEPQTVLQYPDHRGSGWWGGVGRRR